MKPNTGEDRAKVRYGREFKREGQQEESEDKGEKKNGVCVN